MKTNKQKMMEQWREQQKLQKIIEDQARAFREQKLLPLSESKRITDLKSEMIELIDEMYQSELSYVLKLRPRLSEFKLKLLTFY